MPTRKNDLSETRWSLLSRLKNLDDQTSWRVFFETYGNLIYSVASKSGLSHVEAEEVVQETVISVSKKIAQFKADPKAGSFKSWLLNLTRWRVIDQVRKRPPEAEKRDHRRRNPSDSTGSTATEERIPDPAGALEAIWDQEWEKNLVSVALEKIRPEVNGKHFQVFYLHVIKNRDAAKVAKTLSVEVDQVYLIKHRLTKLLRKAIEDIETKLL